MTPVPSPRDLVACLQARRQQLIADAELEAIVRQWLAEPARPLVDVLAERAGLSPGKLAALKAAIDRQAQETVADPLAAHMRALPAGIQRLLAAATGEEPPTV